MTDPPSALKELYNDLDQLRALYSDSTANARTAWAEGASKNPAVPASARNAAAGVSPLSARFLQRPLPDTAQSARGVSRNPYAFCMQMPATARAHLAQGRSLDEVPLPYQAKSARQPPSARPIATPRVAQLTSAPAPTTVPGSAGEDSVGSPYIPPPGTVFEYDGGSSVVLSTHTEPPSEKELLEYAQWLGVDPMGERELTWLAKEALMAPLPPYWRPCNTQDGDVYYFNFATGESLWDHPMDALFKRFVPLERARLQTCRETATPYEVTEAYVHATIGAFLAHLCPAELQQSLMREPTTDPANAPFVPPPGTVFEYDEGGHSTVLDDTAAQHQPTAAEVHEYAQWLGIDVATEGELLWVARDGLTTPLPDPWRPCKTHGGDLYYFNFGTGESAWEHPMDEFFKKLVILERDKLARCKEENVQYSRGAA
eukprot:GGOE01018081.1.p1 GENE.GGOE01018081.1~~GGOE01018081.1.p1  ORF type:complete len:429 (-),score=106.48 GGOE01018081.1:109-1395(-)